MTERVFRSRLRACLYLLLRNDLVWSLLTEEERRKVLANNLEYNNEREDYRNPHSYRGDQSFDTPPDPAGSAENAWLKTFLETHNPAAVVEIGPGSGYFTRTIVEHASVRLYRGVDVNSTFLRFLGERLGAFGKNDLEFGTAPRLEDLDVASFDAVVLMNTLHHIPNRLDLFRQLHRLLKPGGKVLTADPSHYLPRIRQLLGKIRTPRYVENLVAGRSPVGTHHFCTLGESRKIAKKTSFRIVRYRVDAGWRFIPVRVINRMVNALGLQADSYWRRTPLHRWLSHRIMVLFEKV